MSRLLADRLADLLLTAIISATEEIEEEIASYDFQLADVCTVLRVDEVLLTDGLLTDVDGILLDQANLILHLDEKVLKVYHNPASAIFVLKDDVLAYGGLGHNGEVYEYQEGTSIPVTDVSESSYQE